MKKTFVDEISKSGKDLPSPGPDKYLMVEGFGKTEKAGSRYSMRPKNDLFV